MGTMPQCSRAPSFTGYKQESELLASHWCHGSVLWGQAKSERTYYL